MLCSKVQLSQITPFSARHGSSHSMRCLLSSFIFNVLLFCLPCVFVLALVLSPPPSCHWFLPYCMHLFCVQPLINFIIYTLLSLFLFTKSCQPIMQSLQCFCFVSLFLYCFFLLVLSFLNMDYPSVMMSTCV